MPSLSMTHFMAQCLSGSRGLWRAGTVWLGLSMLSKWYQQSRCCCPWERWVNKKFKGLGGGSTGCLVGAAS